ncbi:MAG: choice-of-anchor tandem repeat GloVer-containing protein [Terriglobales bacterium]
MLAQNGNIYGTTNWNQSNIYGITTGGTETLLWQSAQGAGDQCEWQPGTYYPPFNGMTLGADGLLYGACWMWEGNGNSSGVIYKYDPSQGQNGITVVYSFPVGEQTLPNVLTLGTDGNLYGTTFGTGSSSLGTVFQFKPTTNKLTTLHNFQGVEFSDGANPTGPLTLGSNGSFYGTTYGGGVNGGSSSGTVYSITTKGKIKILYSFNTFTNPTSGTNPNAGVAQGNDGNFYGITFSGGTAGQGTIFKVTPAGKLTSLHNFNESADNAGYPVWPLTLGSDGNFYGSAQDCNAGGCSAESLFEIATKAKKGTYTYTNLYNFTNPSSCTGYTPTGCIPSSALLQHPNGNFYGVTADGGGSYPGYATGVFYSLSTGLKPFVSLQFPRGTEGSSLGIFGQGFQTGPATAVSFNGTVASFTVVSDTYMTATIPTGATKGYVTVAEPAGTLQSKIKFTPIK